MFRPAHIHEILQRRGPATERQGRRADEPQLHLRRAVPPVKRHRHLHGRGQQDGRLHALDGLRQHAPHHVEEPAPHTGQPAVRRHAQRGLRPYVHLRTGGRKEVPAGQCRRR